MPLLVSPNSLKDYTVTLFQGNPVLYRVDVQHLLGPQCDGFPSETNA